MSEAEYCTWAVSLCFEENTADRIRSLVNALAKATGNAFLVDNNVPPHITLGMFHVPREKENEFVGAFRSFTSNLPRAFNIQFLPPDNFASKVIFLPVNAAEGDRALRSMNAALHESFLPLYGCGGNRNYLPENWAPHVGLAVKLDGAAFLRGVESLSSECSALVESVVSAPARVSSVSLARCHPYECVESFSLRTDNLSCRQRHVNMSRIRSTGNSCETALRSALFMFGFRFRKNDRRLSGSPDIVFPHYRAVIFINGCFWHAHGWKEEGVLMIDSPLLEHSVPYGYRCGKFRFPKSNGGFWHDKFKRNRERDKRDIEQLLQDGYRVGIVWECSITGRKRASKIYDVASRISCWLEEEYGEVFMEF